MTVFLPAGGETRTATGFTLAGMAMVTHPLADSPTFSWPVPSDGLLLPFAHV